MALNNAVVPAIANWAAVNSIAEGNLMRNLVAVAMAAAAMLFGVAMVTGTAAAETTASSYFPYD